MIILPPRASISTVPRLLSHFLGCTQHLHVAFIPMVMVSCCRNISRARYIIPITITTTIIIGGAQYQPKMATTTTKRAALVDDRGPSSPSKSTTTTLSPSKRPRGSSSSSSSLLPTLLYHPTTTWTKTLPKLHDQADGHEQLALLLRNAGMKVSLISSPTRAVSIYTHHHPPPQMTIDEEVLWMIFGLHPLQEELETEYREKYKARYLALLFCHKLRPVMDEKEHADVLQQVGERL